MFDLFWSNRLFELFVEVFEVFVLLFSKVFEFVSAFWSGVLFL